MEEQLREGKRSKSLAARPVPEGGARGVLSPQPPAQRQEIRWCSGRDAAQSPSLSSRLTPSASPAVKGRRRSPVCVAQDLSLWPHPAQGTHSPPGLQTLLLLTCSEECICLTQWPETGDPLGTEARFQAEPESGRKPGSQGRGAAWTRAGVAGTVASKG